MINMYLIHYIIHASLQVIRQELYFKPQLCGRTVHLPGRSRLFTKVPEVGRTVAGCLR